MSSFQRIICVYRKIVKGFLWVFPSFFLALLLLILSFQSGYAQIQAQPLKGAVVDFEVLGDRDFAIKVRAINMEDEDLCLKSQTLSDALRIGNNDFHLHFINQDFDGEMHWLQPVRIAAKSAQNLQFRMQYDERNLRNAAVSFSDFSPPPSTKLSKIPQGVIEQLMVGVSLFFESCDPSSGDDSPLWVMSAREMVSAQLFPVMKLQATP